MGGKKGKERKRDIKGKEVRIHLGYILYTSCIHLLLFLLSCGNHPATTWQPLGNQTATKNSWPDIKGPYRPPCSRCKIALEMV
nr:MAG TPA: hypothetical protein [Caudoviricetes sp.]